MQIIFNFRILYSFFRIQWDTCTLVQHHRSTFLLTKYRSIAMQIYGSLVKAAEGRHTCTIMKSISVLVITKPSRRAPSIRDRFEFRRRCRDRLVYVYAFAHLYSCIYAHIYVRARYRYRSYIYVYIRIRSGIFVVVVVVAFCMLMPRASFFKAD